MAQFLRVFVVIPGLVVLWRYLYPWLLEVLRSSSPHSNQGLVQILLLLFLTFWFYRYTDGYLSECELRRLSLLPMIACGVKWLIVGVWNLLTPPFSGVSLWYGLNHYTEVPRWLVMMTSMVIFLWFLRRGWLHPESKIAALSSQTRFQ